jgi:hypothetical protein
MCIVYVHHVCMYVYLLHHNVHNKQCKTHTARSAVRSRTTTLTELPGLQHRCRFVLYEIFTDGVMYEDGSVKSRSISSESRSPNSETDKLRLEFELRAFLAKCELRYWRTTEETGFHSTSAHFFFPLCTNGLRGRG